MHVYKTKTKKPNNFKKIGSEDIVSSYTYIFGSQNTETTIMTGLDTAAQYAFGQDTTIHFPEFMFMCLLLSTSSNQHDSTVAPSEVSS